MDKSVDSLISSSTRLGPRDRTPGEGSTMPAPWSLNSGQNAGLASVFEPQGDRRAETAVYDRRKKCANFSKKRTSGRDIPRPEYRERTRENASDPDSRSFGCSQKSARVATSRFPVFILGLKKKKHQHLLSKQPRCQSSTSEAHNRCPTPEFNTHTHSKLLNKS